MSQRFSEYARKPQDEYFTPAWVTTALIPHLPPIATIWEPAAGSGLMVEALRRASFAVNATDIATGDDFLLSKANGAAAIIINPPYALAQEFIEHALALMAPVNGVVAMLLRWRPLLFNHITSRQSATLAFKDMPFLVPVFRIGFDQLDSRQCPALWAHRDARSWRRRWGQYIRSISHAT